MTMGKDSRIVRLGIGLDWRGSVREWGRIVLAKGRPKREIRDAAVGGMLMYLMDKHLQLIIVLVRLCGTTLVPFSCIYTVSCKFHSFTSPEPGLCVHVQRIRT